MPNLLTYPQILERMRNNFALEFGSHPSDVSLRFLEVDADEDDALYGACLEILASFYSGTATGTDLDNRLGDLGLFRKKGFKATTFVTFGTDFPAEEDLIIPVGTTVVSKSGAAFLTTAQAIIFTGESQVTNVPVQADAEGVDHNVGVGEITGFAGFGPRNVTTITNPEPVQNGQDVELDPDYRARFPDYIKSLARGTIPAIRSATIAVDGVTDLYIKEQAEGTGSFYLYIDDGNGGSVSSVVNAIYKDLVDAVTLKLRTYYAGGVKFLVKPVGRKLIDVTFHLVVKPGFSRVAVEAEAVALMREHLNTYIRGELTDGGDLLSVLLEVDGVTDKNPNDLEETTSIIIPTSDPVVQPWEIIRAGNVIAV